MNDAKTTETSEATATAMRNLAGTMIALTPEQRIPVNLALLGIKPTVRPVPTNPATPKGL